MKRNLARNYEIMNKFKEGFHIHELATIYKLSESWISTIIKRMAYKKICKYDENELRDLLT